MAQAPRSEHEGSAAADTRTVEERLAAVEARLSELEGALAAATGVDRRAVKAANRAAKRARRAPGGRPSQPASVTDGEFAQLIEDPSVGVAADFSAASTTALLAFGGMALKMGMPPFEFFALTRELPVKRLYVRDIHQAWYHRGVPGYGDTIDDLAVRLRELIDEQGVQRLVVAGNSAGGYGALLFGTLLQADVVLSFSPQTILDRSVLAAIDDHRWDVKLNRLEAAGGPDPRFTDLGAALPALANGVTRCEVHYAAPLALDAHHANRVAAVPGLRLHAHPEGGHSVIRLLRRTGELSQVLARALQGD
jgi:hypothetical protein